MDTSPPILKLRNYGLAFGDRVVLNAVSLDITGPGCTVLLGPSGTGKSSLLRTLAGFNHSNPSLRTWGEASLCGAPCTSPHQPVLVMQNSKLLVSNVLENLVCSLPDRAELTQSQQRERIADVLASTRQEHLLRCLHTQVIDHPISEQRIIAVLRQYLSGAPLLMIDEPTAELDEHEAEPILQLIEQLSEEHTLLVVMHRLSEARRLAQRVVLLANGQVEEATSADEFFNNPQSECARQFVSTGSCAERAQDERLLPPSAPAPCPPATLSAAPAPVTLTTPVTLTGPMEFVSERFGPRGFLWLLPGQLAGTPWPGVVHDTRYDLASLRAVGVTRLISLTEEPFDPTLAQEFGIRCHSSPMPDMHPPSREQAIALCSAIDDYLANGEVIAVHCFAGLGRTGTVLALYWLWRAAGQLSALQALEHVRRIEPRWVQSRAQVDFLEAFARTVQEMNNRQPEADGALPPSGATKPALHREEERTTPHE